MIMEKVKLFRLSFDHLRTNIVGIINKM